MINHWLSFSMEGNPVRSREERATCKAEILLILDAYDSARPSTLWYTDINGNLSKGYIGYKQ